MDGRQRLARWNAGGGVVQGVEGEGMSWASGGVLWGAGPVGLDVVHRLA